MNWTVKDDGAGGYIATKDDGRVLSIPADPANRHYQQLQKWIAEGGVVQTADPPPAGPTLDEIYDSAMRSQRVFKAYALAINDGSIVPGANMSKAALKAAVKAKM